MVTIEDRNRRSVHWEKNGTCLQSEHNVPHVSHAVTFVTLVAFCDFPYSTHTDLPNFEIILKLYLINIWFLLSTSFVFI